jgi:hypothetical protein
MQGNLVVGMLVHGEILSTQRTFQGHTAEAYLAVLCGAEMDEGLGAGLPVAFSMIGVGSL